MVQLKVYVLFSTSEIQKQEKSYFLLITLMVKGFKLCKISMYINICITKTL